MKRSHWARATGPSLIMVDWGPLRLNTWCSLLQPGSTTRARAAASAAPTREMGRKAERVRVMCNSGSISGVRCAKCIGGGFGIFKAFQSQNHVVNSPGAALLISLHHALGKSDPFLRHCTVPEGMLYCRAMKKYLVFSLVAGAL